MNSPLRFFAIVAFCLSLSHVTGQPSSTYYSPYGGVLNVRYNPALAHGIYVTDVCLSGLSEGFTGNTFSLSPEGKFSFSPYAFKSRYDGAETESNQKLYEQYHVSGPGSFLVSTGKEGKNNSAFGLVWNTHVISVFDTRNAGLVSSAILRTPLQPQNSQTPASGHTTINTLAWADLGLVVSHEFLIKPRHSLSVGITAKYLQGFDALHFSAERINESWQNDTLQIEIENLTYYHSRSFDLSEGWFPVVGSGINGVGADAGIVYRWLKPDSAQARYLMNGRQWPNRQYLAHRLAAGLSVTDLGKLKFNNDLDARSGNFQLALPATASAPYTSLSEFDTLFTTGQSRSEFETWLPAQLNFYADAAIWKNVGLQTAASMAIRSATEVGVRPVSVLSVTPRFDLPRFGFYLPVQIMTGMGLRMGAGLRLGPFFAGTNDLGGLISNKSGHAQWYVAVRIPILSKPPKDTDGDFVSDKLDKCPLIRGEWTAIGCPDADLDSIPDNVDLCPQHFGLKKHMGCPDRDGDEVVDHLDRCPDMPGPESLEGCPDRDGDGIADDQDACPDEAGNVLTNGCPDRDGDGIIDNEDKCPEYFGQKEHQGCPDRDNDGVYDYEDDCPDTPGVNNPLLDGCPDEDGDGVRDSEDDCPGLPGNSLCYGCPKCDSDNDGVIDRFDLCPDLPGRKENHGCPDNYKEKFDRKKNYIILFSNDSTIKTRSLQEMDLILKLLNDYPAYTIAIRGIPEYSDDPDAQIASSMLKANVVYQELKNRGVAEARITIDNIAAKIRAGDRSVLPDNVDEHKAEIFVLYQRD